VTRFAFIILLGVFVQSGLFADDNGDEKILTPEMLGMPRQQIHFTDNQLRLFNGRGSIYTERYSLTGLHNISFPPIDLPLYHFHFDFFPKQSLQLIRDDIPEMWEQWKKYKTGTDPLGANFRPGFATVLVSQDEYWEPNNYYREGTFHKKYDKTWVSFFLRSEASVSGQNDEVYLKIIIQNRMEEELTLTLIPQQQVGHQPRKSAEFVNSDPFTISDKKWMIRVSSDLQKTNNEGWIINIPGGKEETACFVISALHSEEEKPDLYQINIDQRINEARVHTVKRLNDAASALPIIVTENKTLDEFYKRCILSVVESRWQRENFIVDPFWAVGTWLFTITWDNSFFADMLSMIDPQSMRETIMTAMGEGKMECTYIGWSGGSPGIIYIQEPFALRVMIDAYLRQTGDTGFLDESIAGKTVFAWMKAWVDKLYDEYRSPHSGLIDMGEGTEELIEIRTDGYNHIVPVVNGLTVELQNWIADWCRNKKDSDSSRFRKQAEDLEKLFHEQLWNPHLKWFDNVYPDGSRKSVFTNHLFDLLGTRVLSAEEKVGLISHLNDREFLGPFNMYSISRQDKVHWDLIDSDWGGGGAYTGMPLRLVRDLYRLGQSNLAWTILSRFSQYINFFPYISQNLRADEPFQDESSMPLQVSAGAGVEAIVFGMFGLEPFVNGTLDIRPYYHYQVGNARLEGYRFRGHIYDVDIKSSGFTVYRDSENLGTFPLGGKIHITPQGQVLNWKDLETACPRVVSDELYFIKDKEISLSCATPKAKIYYTLDGSEPDQNSLEYKAPILLKKSSSIKTKAYADQRKPSKVARIYLEKLEFSDPLNPQNVINIHPYPDIIPEFTLSVHHKPEYGFYTLLDGHTGSDHYSDGQWIGQEEGDLEFILKWPVDIPVKLVETNFIVNTYDWIFLPEEVSVEVSADNSNYMQVGKVRYKTDQDSRLQYKQNIKMQFEKKTIRYLKFKAKNIKTCPEWHHGAGGKAWIFMDELLIK